MELLEEIAKWLSSKESHREKEVGKNYKYKDGRGRGPETFILLF